MNRTIITILVTLTTTLTLADWRVGQKVDPITDEVRTIAFVENEQGHTFSVYRIPGAAAVWGNFALSDKKMEQLDDKKPPVFRIDKHKPHDLNDAKRTQEILTRLNSDTGTYEWTPKWVNFLIWHGKPEEGLTDKLIELMEGQKLIVRYYLFTGGYKDTAFTLKGSAPAIADAAGIDAKVDHAAQAKQDAYEAAYWAEMQKCQDMLLAGGESDSEIRRGFDKHKPCSDKVMACGKKAARNLSVFQDCIEE